MVVCAYVCVYTVIRQINQVNNKCDVGEIKPAEIMRCRSHITQLVPVGAVRAATDTVASFVTVI
jgi:hypothetical protein